MKKRIYNLTILLLIIVCLSSCSKKTDSFITISSDMKAITYNNNIYIQLPSRNISVNDLNLISNNPTINNKKSTKDSKDINIYSVCDDTDNVLLHVYYDGSSKLYCREDHSENVEQDIENANFENYKFMGRNKDGSEYCIDISENLGNMLEQITSNISEYIKYDTVEKNIKRPYIYLYAYTKGLYFSKYIGFIFSGNDGNMYILSSYTDINDSTYIPYRTYLIDPIYYNEIEQIIARN